MCVCVCVCVCVCARVYACLCACAWCVCVCVLTVLCSHVTHDWLWLHTHVSCDASPLHATLRSGLSAIEAKGKEGRTYRPSSDLPRTFTHSHVQHTLPPAPTHVRTYPTCRSSARRALVPLDTFPSPLGVRDPR